MFHATEGKIESPVQMQEMLGDFSGVQWGKNGLQKG
jgi:hypothetical protein